MKTDDADRSPTAAETTGSATSAPSEADAEAAEPDYAHDAGRTMKEYDYPDDPEPAESVAATLCNLNRGYFEVLQPTKGGEPVVDGTLSTAVLSLSDLLDYWDSLRPHYPQLGADIDTAWAIRDAWDQALLEFENGESSRAQDTMEEAQEYIEKLPASSHSGCIDSAPGTKG